MTARHLADANVVRIAPREVQHFVSDQPVVQDYVRFLQGPQRVQGQQAGVAGTRAHQGDAATPRRIGLLQGAFEFTFGARQVIAAHQRGHLPTHHTLIETATRIDVRQPALNPSAPALQQACELTERPVEQ